MVYCRDTGVAVVDVCVVRGCLRGAYTEEYLRASMVYDPVFERKNLGDNLLPIIHYEIVPGDRLKLIFALKGAGSENTSRLAMLKPADG
jgi:fumarate hydratase subunit alpha